MNPDQADSHSWHKSPSNSQPLLDTGLFNSYHQRRVALARRKNSRRTTAGYPVIRAESKGNIKLLKRKRHCLEIEGRLVYLL
jgi:hypothetical protein